jgi:hypothetical protein
MKSLAFLPLVALMFSLPQCMSQTPEWGPSVRGILLSVSMTNATVRVGSNVTITVCVTNASTNLVIMGDTGGGLYDNNVVVTDSAGNAHDFTPREAVRAFIHNLLIYIRPAASHSEQLELHFGSEFKPGDYICRVKRPITFQKDGKLTKDSWCDLISNALKIKIE